MSEQTTPRSGFDAIRLGGNIGAEIRGLDLRQPMPPATFDDLNAAFVKHEVLVFRDQDITLRLRVEPDRDTKYRANAWPCHSSSTIMMNEHIVLDQIAYWIAC